MKLAACCCTFLRPDTLGELVESFLRQDYPAELRELVILDDAGQYGEPRGSGWRVVAVDRRFATLGEKRNHCARLVATDTEGLLVADDDDIYLPHWFRAQADALSRAEWTVPSRVWLAQGARLRLVPALGAYHGGWGFRRSFFERLGGYAPLSNGEDQELSDRAWDLGGAPADPTASQLPFYMHRRGAGGYSASDLLDFEFAALAERLPAPRATIEPHWRRDYAQWVRETSA